MCSGLQNKRSHRDDAHFLLEISLYNYSNLAAIKSTKSNLCNKTWNLPHLHKLCCCIKSDTVCTTISLPTLPVWAVCKLFPFPATPPVCKLFPSKVVYLFPL